MGQNEITPRTGDVSTRDVSAWDVVVYGGTGAGVAAAIAAARGGCRVVLLEPGQHVGGITVEGLGASDIDNHPEFRNASVVSGLALDFYRRIGRAYGSDAPGWRFEPHVAEAVFADMLNDARVDVRLGCALAETGGVTMKSGRITEVCIESGERFGGSVFIDATIEGDLLHGAGVTTVIGREPNSRYGESRNGIRHENTYRQFAVRVDPYVEPGRPSSGLIATIQDEPLGEEGAGDHRVQAYCFRLCLTDTASNRISFEAPADYDASRYEIYRRYAAAGGKLWEPYAAVPGKKTDLGSWHDLSANLYGMNHAYPAGDRATRRRILDEHASFTRGLCWFLSTDPALPQGLRDAWRRWGNCRDEFKDNDGWPRQFYVRDARRIVGDVVVTEHHTRKGGPDFHDSVAVTWWPPDVHHVRRIVRDGAAYNEGFMFGGSDWRPFGVPYRAMLPRRAECANLITPTCVSASHVAYGAIRLEWTFKLLGHAAGVAARLACAKPLANVHDVDSATLRQRLVDEGVVVDAPR
jgi:FAD dependent oxidoreductase